MKKRRVLALFLALSMALSSNGFTALAAEQDPAVAIEAGLSEGTDETNGENIASDANDENGNNASENEDDAQDNTGENGDASEGGSDVSDGGNVSDGSDETEGGNSSDNNDGTGENGTDETGNGNDAAEGSDVSDGMDGTGNDVDASDETDGPETDIEDAESAEDVQIDDEGVEAVNSTGVHMCTFTDETGMVVTYDLDASEDYIYEVDETDPANPVLTGIFEMVNGVEQPVALSGVVELRQPREDEKNFNTIASSVFKNKTEIEYVILPDNVKNIAPEAFSGCIKLRGIKLPLGLEKIQDKTFFGCTKLTQLSIPKGVTSIGSEAFSGDTSLFMVYIKDSTYSSMGIIGNSAFEGCKKLEKFGSDTDFVLPGNLTEIGANAFKDCHAIKKVTLPDSVKEQWVDVKDPVTGEVQKDSNGEPIKEKVGVGLGAGAFENCIGLTDVTLSAVSDIPDRAFYNCSNLLSVKFANGNKTIGVSAFEKCIRLGQVIFSNTIDKVCDKAFNGCSNLRYVEIPNANMKEIPPSTNVFPNNNADILWMRGFAGTEVEKYAKAHNNMRFIAYTENSTEYFTYTYQCLSANVSGTLTFACDDKVTDPNAKNGKKGVYAGTKIYIFVKSSSSVKLTEGSLRCNGTPIGKDSDGEYTFNMPVGGAYVTAEFERISQDNKNTLGSASDIKYELSNGGSLKVGQTTRLFLIDTSAQAGDSVIESSKIKFTSKNTSVASVSNDGTIKALKKGTAYITAEVLDCNNTRVTRGVDIDVVDAEVRALLLKPFSYDSGVVEDITTDPDGIVLNKVSVENRETTFTLLATAYDDEDVSVADNMSVALKWTTSDSKVAKIGKSSTASAESQNKITIPKGASGEAVITATAANTNPTSDKYKTVSAKFIVRVKDFTPRLAASTLTLNPYKADGVELEIIGAYNTHIDVDTVELRKHDDKEAPSEDFVLSRPNDAETDNTDNSIAKLIIKPRNASNISDGVYKATVLVEADGNFYYLPLNIKVKRFIPKPKVTIAKNQPKINLFYANGGTLQKDGSIEPGEVIPVISNLGELDATDITYSLEPLSTSADDAKFINNFEIDLNEGIITRTNEAMEYTSGKKAKPVVTGYLVLTFDGYIEPFNQQRYKITIPTKTTKPSLKLERTSDTFKLGMSDTPDVYLALKNGKEKINLNEGGWEIYKDAEGSTSSAVTIDPYDCISDDGSIKLSVNTKGSAGKVVIAVKNNEWDGNQVIKLNYTAKISSKKTTFKLDKSSVTLNKYFSSNTATVTFKSNQYGVLAENMDFEYPSNLSGTKEEEYSKVSFTSDPESQQVTVSVADDIKKGSYRFTCKPLGDNGNKVTLTVKVTDVSPTVSLKGSAKLNLNAGDADTTELTMNFKNKPADIDLNWDDTTIEYVTNREDEDDVRGYFIFNRDGNKLKISLADGVTSSDLSAKTYTFKMTPAYGDIGVDEDTARSVRFKVKVYSKEISVTLKAKGRLNLLDRYDDTYFDNTDVPATESLSMAGEDGYATVVDNEAVPSFVEGEDGNGEDEGDGTGEPSESEPSTTTKDLSVELEYDEEQVSAELKEVVTTESGDTDEDTEVNIITVDADGKPTKKYELTVTAVEGYEITSINVYDSSAKDETNGWIGNPILSGDVDAGKLTIDTDSDFSGVGTGNSITIVITSKESTTEDPGTEDPDDPTYTLTLTKLEKGVADLGYCVIDNVNELDGTEEYTPIEDLQKDIGSITSEQIVAVKVTPSDGYEVNEGSFTMTVDEGEDLPTIEEDTALADASSKVFLIKGIAANTDITIKANYIAGKPVKFVKNIGEGTEIKKPIDGNDETFGDISSEEKTTDEGYTFVVQKATGKEYEISVAVYATDEYDDSSSDLTGINPIKEQLVGEEIPGKNALKYTIAFEDIKDVSGSGITIVVTENHTVTINNTAESKVTNLEYKIASGSEGDSDETGGYLPYNEGNKPKLKSDEKLSLRFKMLSMEETELIVVRTTDSKGNCTTIKELAPTDSVDDIYYVEDIEIDEDTTITISIETMQKVTLPTLSDLTEKVTAIKYVMVDSLNSVYALTDNDFNTVPADGEVPFSGDKYLAFKLTLNAGYTVKSFIQEVTSEEGTASQTSLEFNKIEVTGLGDIYQLTEKITDGMVISIQIATSYTITFDKVGPATGGAKIMKSDGTTEITSGGTDSVAEGEDYKFITDKVVDVAASYINATGETVSIDDIEGTQTSDNGFEYTIKKDDIKGNINIVVTDTYKITIKNSSTDVVGTYSYRIGSETYKIYDDITTPLIATVPYNESLSIKIQPVPSKTVLLIEELADSGKKILDADAANSTETDTVYTISNVTAAKTIIISQAYKVTEEITSTDSKTDTAAVEYTNGIKNDSGSEMYALAGSNLAFKVMSKPGYTLTVGYKLSGETTAHTLEESNPTTAETDGYYAYSIASGDISGDITITVTTARKNAEYNIVKFNVIGATVQLDGETGNITPADWKLEIPVSNPTAEQKTFKFKVNADSDKILRYVGTDKALKAQSPEITGPDSDGFYTFTLPEDPDPETIIYIKASEPGAANVDITFAGLTSASQPQPMADIYKVEFDPAYATNKKITTTSISGSSVTEVPGDSKFYFIVRAKSGYTLSSVTVDGKSVPRTEYDVRENVTTENEAADTSKVYIYELTLQDQDVTVTLELSSSGSVVPGPDEPEIPRYPYDPKSCIIYTPVVSNLKDTVDGARIYDASGRVPDFEEVSDKFDIHVVDGLLYVMPKKDAELDNNKVYPVKIWIHFSKYDSGIDEGGIWVKNTIKIKTAQILLKVTASTNTINLYQSNTGYTATFILRTKENSIGTFKHEDEADETTKAIVFGEKDEKAKNSLDVKTEVRKDGSLMVTVQLKEGALYAANSTNKVKMYVKFENQAENTLGTAITMNVKVNK